MLKHTIMMSFWLGTTLIADQFVWEGRIAAALVEEIGIGADAVRWKLAAALGL